MAALVFVVGALVILAVVPLLTRIPRPAAMMFVVLVSLAMLPYGVYVPLLFALVLIVALSGRRGIFPLRFLPLLIVGLVQLMFAWGDTSEQRLGYLVLLYLVLSWWLGAYLAQLVAEDRRAERLIALIILGIVSIETFITVLQWVGVDIFPSSVRNAEFAAASRANGTFAHPGTLGKALIFLVVLVLPLTRSADAVTRRFSFLAMGLAVVPIGISESRTNFLAYIVLAVTWAVLLPRGRKLGARFFVPATVIVVSLAFLDSFIARFEADPEGGARGHLMEIALAHMPENLFLGVGAKSYVTYFGQYDPLTAEGWLVHNVFVLETAELGLIGAILLFLPLLEPAVRAFRNVRRADSRADYSRSTIAMLPAIVVIGFGGWGLANGETFFLWFFVTGYLAQRVSLVQEDRSFERRPRRRLGRVL
ncbi:O-antigen ligase family protein [Microbacterium sp.]|uniref:O-antigen ligase family protein n=1 Tax=Microbacterium sp. TaxID=51671 RepID=UPI003C263847